MARLNIKEQLVPVNLNGDFYFNVPIPYYIKSDNTEHIIPFVFNKEIGNIKFEFEIISEHADWWYCRIEGNNLVISTADENLTYKPYIELVGILRAYTETNVLPDKPDIKPPIQTGGAPTDGGGSDTSNVSETGGESAPSNGGGSDITNNTETGGESAPSAPDETEKTIEGEITLVLRQTYWNDDLIYDPTVLINEVTDVRKNPIWKDEIINAEYMSYLTLIDANSAEIKYNGVVQPYLSSQINITDILRNSFDINEFPFVAKINKCNQVLNLMAVTSQNYGVMEDVVLLNNHWNYTGDYNANEIGGNYSAYNKSQYYWNVIDYYDPRQLVCLPLVITNDNQTGTFGNLNVHVIGKDDVITLHNIFSMVTDDVYFTRDVYNIVYKPLSSNEYITYKVKNHRYNTIAKSKCTKARYCLYYMNKAGLWCWMLFEGKTIESISTKKTSYNRESPNNASHYFGKIPFMTSVSEIYDLTTVYLTDTQSKKLLDLYCSPLVYLHDLEEDGYNLYAVTVDTTTYQVKTFKNQGRKYFTQTIKVTKSKDKNIIVN